MIRPQKYQVVVADKKQLNDKVFYLTFLLINPKEITFSAGQRGLFNIGPKFSNYSICSFEEDKNKISICVDTTPDGPGSKWIKDRKIGDNVQLIAPLGNFFLTTDVDKPKIFLATGTGVSPIRPMINKLLKAGFNKQIYLYFGERYISDIFWQDEFSLWQNQFSNFHYQIVLSRSDSTWVGKKGYIQTVMEKELFVDLKNSPLDYDYYICGNGGMIANSVNLLTKYQVTSQNIHFEKFYDP